MRNALGAGCGIGVVKSSVTHRIFGACLAIVVATAAWAQAPVGTIAGTVRDQSDAVMPGVTITIRHEATGVERHLTSNADGTFAAPSLAAGNYAVVAELTGFRTQRIDVTVATGRVATLDMRMELGEATETVTVAASAIHVETEAHAVTGVITRQEIQELPLNGRSFLQLAFLEPGVTANPGTTSQYNSLFSVSILGGDSNKTAITVDGGNVRNSIEGNTAMNFSQEVVEEFQLSTANFDLSTGITSVGAVNVVTRSGGNDVRGSSYFFFRNNDLAANPSLRRDPLNPDPYFARRNPGAWIGGPIRRDRAFYFMNYEYTSQDGVHSFQPNLASASELAGVFPTPYRGHLFSTRLDLRAGNNHTGFLRFSHDKNSGFGPSGGASLPSNWLRNVNRSEQVLFGLTSILRPTLLNDFRVNFTYWRNRNLFADESTCVDCVGLGFPQLNINGTNVTVGNTSNATQGRDLYRYTFVDTLTWVKGAHRFRFGTEIEYAPGTGFWGFCDPACTVGFSPEFIRGVVPGALVGALFRTLPTAIRTNEDLLNLPFAGGVVGVGDPAQPPPYNVDKAKVNNRIRFYGQDTWRVGPRFTLNYGLAWNFESTLVNRDLDKPAYLAPLYGSDLSPTKNNYNNWSPSFGFAWTLDDDSRTVVRGGAGLYWETELLWRRLRERAAIGPVGNGRLLVPHTSFVNIFPGIINLNTGQPVPIGAPLPASGQLTNLTVGQFMQIYDAQIGALQAQLAPTNLNDLSIRNIQLGKTAADLYPSEYPVQHAIHMNLGVQRELGGNMVLGVEFVRRVFEDTLLGSLDWNRFNRYINGVQTPVIPRCVTAAERSDPNAQCSNGAITFWTPGGREVYNGLLFKLDKRFSNRYLFGVSYALANRSGINGISNLDDYFASYGPNGPRHVLNVSGLINLPGNVQVGFISAMSSRSPVMPSITNVDLDGDGTATTPIPGVDFNCFNRGCDEEDLAQAVAAFNQQYAGQRDARGQLIAPIVLPANYDLGDNFSSQDLRVTKTFDFGTTSKVAVFVEVFNIFNVANLGGYSFNLSNTATFGQATNRASQVFGSGGPRAFQVGGRFTF
ncbi:MAG TPA: carboxypeptidase regulatory-like domain-containing protein [Vicinamibacterales bacterium]|nr:carboxypeptidase regulatory-like domain-containing protein [Vicinamibacterales bacterium]